MSEATLQSAVPREEVNHHRDIQLLQVSTDRVHTEAQEEAIQFHHEAVLKDQAVTHLALRPMEAAGLHLLHHTVHHQVLTLQVLLLQVHPVLHQAEVQEAAVAAVVQEDSLNNKIAD
jgi:hypothetical protein